MENHTKKHFKHLRMIICSISLLVGSIGIGYSWHGYRDGYHRGYYHGSYYRSYNGYHPGWGYRRGVVNVYGRGGCLWVPQHQNIHHNWVRGHWSC